MARAPGQILRHFRHNRQPPSVRKATVWLRGGTYPCAFNAANEVAVAAFLDGRIAWTAIADINAEALDAGTGNVHDVADVLEADRVARQRATIAVERLDRAA